MDRNLGWKGGADHTHYPVPQGPHSQSSVD